MHGATAGTGQLEKNNFYMWRTIINKCGEMEFIDVPYDITVENTKIKQLSISEATKSLGVTYTPASDWTEQFLIMKNKMTESVSKLMSTSVQPHQVHMFYHTYLITKVFFGCAVMHLTEKQDTELRKIYEISILKN